MVDDLAFRAGQVAGAAEHAGRGLFQQNILIFGTIGTEQTHLEDLASLYRRAFDE